MATPAGLTAPEAVQVPAPRAPRPPTQPPCHGDTAQDPQDPRLSGHRHLSGNTARAEPGQQPGTSDPQIHKQQQRGQL